MALTRGREDSAWRAWIESTMAIIITRQDEPFSSVSLLDPEPGDFLSHGDAWPNCHATCNWHRQVVVDRVRYYVCPLGTYFSDLLSSWTHSEPLDEPRVSGSALLR